MTTKVFQILLILFFSPIILLISIAISILVKITSKGPILFWSNRVGGNGKNFLMPKFRTMQVETPEVATHLLENPKAHITKIGKFLRKYSLDEIPQILSVLSGDMNIVGPRPALFSQEDLIELRHKYKIDKIKPGITGWAQVNGRDEISITEKVNLDLFYANNKGFYLDLKILFITIKKVLFKTNISH